MFPLMKAIVNERTCWSLGVLRAPGPRSSAEQMESGREVVHAGNFFRALPMSRWRKRGKGCGMGALWLSQTCADMRRESSADRHWAEKGRSRMSSVSVWHWLVVNLITFLTVWPYFRFLRKISYPG